MDKKRIGLPKALLNYYYYPFWKTLFTELGFETVLSDDTNSAIIEKGAGVTVSELCVPIKIYNGHVVNLVEKGVDYIFIARFVRMKKEWYCPKFIGLGEVVDYSVNFGTSVPLYVDITSDTDVPDKLSDYMVIADTIGVSKGQLKAALKSAREVFLRCRELSHSGYTMSEVFDKFDGKTVEPAKKDKPVTIALLGYVNNIYDNFVSMHAIGKLRGMGVNVLTFDMVDEEILARRKKRERLPFWVFARKIYKAAEYFLENDMVDGIIHLTAFGCGPDSIIGKLMECYCEDRNIPMMTLRVDEHTGESHVQTRLEAFIDMLNLRKKREADQAAAARTGGEKQI